MKSQIKRSAFTFLAAGLLFGACKKPAPPTMTLNGDAEMTIYIGETFNDPGVSAKDYNGKDISSNILQSGSVGTPAGYYTINYSVSDGMGNSNQTSRGVRRAIRNTDLVGTYNVTQYTTNGGGTQTYTATVTASTANSLDITMNNTSSTKAPVTMTANISGMNLNIPNQSSGSISITNGMYGLMSNSTGPMKLTVSFQTFNGTMTYNHDATWTKL